MIDASDFFNACESNWVWDNLTALTLTSRLLIADEDSATCHINRMLEDAGRSALRMPQLRSMVIWYGWKELANAFRTR
jgi:hypothetical protein